MIAACYGYLSASFTADREVRLAMTRFSAKWALTTLTAAIAAGCWYVAILPTESYGLVMGKSPTIAAVLPWWTGGLLGLLLIMLGAGILRPKRNLKPVASLAMLCALLVMGGFEWTREAARRPYVINEVMYSNSILKKDVEAVNRNGYLRTALWVQNRDVSEVDITEAGRELFEHQCYACHTIGGRNNDIVRATSRMSYRALVNYIQKIHEVRYFMPPFVGTELESQALAAYIAGGLHGKDVQESQEIVGSVGKGLVLFEENCSSCHAVEELTGAFDGLDRTEIIGMLTTLNEISDEMEPFSGSQKKQEQLAFFLSSGGEEQEVQEEEINGKNVFRTHCAVCHSVPDMEMKLADREREEIFVMLGELEQLQRAMPPFRGTPQERQALADYLDRINQGGQ